MFTPCWPSAGPTGGAGVACPPGHWSFTFAVTTLAIAARFLLEGDGRSIQRVRSSGACHEARGWLTSYPGGLSDPLHLPVFEVDRGRPVEDDQHDLDQAAGLDDLVDGALEVFERAVLDLDPVAALDVDPDLGGLLGLGGRLLAEHVVDLGLGHLGRRAVGAD